MIDQCVIEFKDLHIVGISHEEIHIVRASLKAHFNASKTIPGTRKSHHFILQTK